MGENAGSSETMELQARPCVFPLFQFAHLLEFDKNQSIGPQKKSSPTHQNHQTWEDRNSFYELGIVDVGKNQCLTVSLSHGVAGMKSQGLYFVAGCEGPELVIIE